MELLNYTALRCTMTEVCECEVALKFSDIIVLINAGFYEETLHSSISIYKKKRRIYKSRNQFFHWKMDVLLWHHCLQIKPSRMDCTIPSRHRLAQSEPFAPRRDCSLKNRISMDESRGGISKLCGLIRKVSQKPQEPIKPREETGEGKTS